MRILGLMDDFPGHNRHIVCFFALNMRRLFLLVPLFIVAATPVFGEVNEPQYGGRTISEWLLTDRQQNGQTEERKFAILHMGSNCLPYLIKATQVDSLNLDNQLSQQQVEVWRTNLLRKMNAMDAFATLGRQASPAIPELIRLSREGATEGNRLAAISVLEVLEKDGFKAILEIASDTSHPQRGDAIFEIGTMHHEINATSLVAVPILMKCLNEKDPKIISSAAVALGNLGVQAETVVPALTNLMRNGNAQIRASVLYAFQSWPEAGALYAPTLITALGDADLEVRQAATNALISSPAAIHRAGNMGEPARAAVPIFIEALGGEHVGAEAAEALGNLGFDAAISVGALKRYVRDLDTPVGVASANALAKFGAKASWAAPELEDALGDARVEIRIAATNALLNVMPDAVTSKQSDKNTNPGIFRN